MTREAFIKVLETWASHPYNKDTLDIYGKEKDFIYEIEGDKIIVTYKGDVGLGPLKQIPSVVEFKNDGDVNLRSLPSLPPGVEFKNTGDVHLGYLIGGMFSNWEGNIKGIDSKRLLNSMVSKGIFER